MSNFDVDAFLKEHDAPEPSPVPITPTADPAQMDLSVSQFDPDQFIRENEIAHHEEHEKELAPYRTPGQTVLAGAEALGRGIAGPLAPAAELATGLTTAEDIRKREEANEVASTAGEAAGFFAPSALIGKAGEAATGLAKLAEFAQPELIEKAAAKAVEHLPLVNSLAGKIGKPAAKLAVESALFTGSDELSKAVLQDPEQSVASAAAHIGAAGLLGLGLGGASSLFSSMADKAAGSKLTQFAEDFKGRVQEHLDDPNPVESFTKQLDDHYKNIKELADDVYGPNGLKEQDIKLAMPKEPGKPIEQSNNIREMLEEVVDSMHQDTYSYPPRLAKKLQADLDHYSTQVQSNDPAKIFDAVQDLKQKMQGYAKFDKSVAPHAEEYDFVKSAKEIHDGLRHALEDEDVWGKAAIRQKEINKAFSQYLPKLQDFEKKFTSEVNNENIIDPAKIESFFAQLGGAKSEVKKQVLDNFMKASDKYRSAIEDTHANLGLTPPNVRTPSNAIHRALKRTTDGEKAADWLIEKGINKQAGDIAGAAAGSILARHEHLPGGGLIGAAAGHMFLGPVINSVFPTIAKKLLSSPSVLNGIVASAKMIDAVAKGDALLNKGVKAIFVEGAKQITNPSPETYKKLDKAVQKLSANPEKMADGGSALNSYNPEVAENVNAANARVITYLNTQRPHSSPLAPMDHATIPGPVEEANYKNAMTIALSPAVVLDKMRDGTLTPKDLADLNAMYPALHKNISEKLLNQITKVKIPSKIPFKTKTMVSMFLAQPMSSSMSQPSIVAAQTVFANMAHKNDTLATKPATRPSAPALQKFSTDFNTPNQALNRRKGEV